MIGKLKPKSEFSRNVLTLMTGTTIAQAIPIAISPILTRIYTPEDFGMFALYMSISMILAVLVSGRYELAIMLPKKDEDAFGIMILSIYITLIVSSVVLVLMLLFNTEIAVLLENEEISTWLYLIPFSILFVGLYQSFNYWNNRKKKYKRLATNRVVQSGTVASVNLVLGFNGFGSGGLILGSIIGQCVAMIRLARTTFKYDTLYWDKIKGDKLLELAKKYSNFPKYSVASDLLTVLNSQLVVFFILKLFALSSVGFFALVVRVVSIPTAVLSSAIGDVFRQQSSEYYALHQECSAIYLKTLKKLVLLGVMPFILFFIFAPPLFAFIFGERWYVAGEYAQMLTPMFFLQFISSPFSTIFYIVGEQALYLKIITVTLTMMLALFFIVYIYNLSIEFFLIGYASVYSLLYIVNLLVTYNLSKKRAE